mmetsp:Transcript_32668/g.83464  ORF Transcript_32668/g.83464 Transcript_32668/m.83464 type:complete len:492 (+) Transcript_32668:169-1644(+)
MAPFLTGHPASLSQHGCRWNLPCYMLQGAQPPPSPHPRSHHHAAHDPAGWAAPGPAGGSRLLIEDSPVEHCLQLGASSAEAPTSLLLLAPPPAFMPSLTDVVVDPEGTGRQQRHLQEPAPVREQPGTVLRLEAAVDAAHQVHVLHADRHRPAAQVRRVVAAPHVALARARRVGEVHDGHARSLHAEEPEAAGGQLQAAAEEGGDDGRVRHCHHRLPPVLVRRAAKRLPRSSAPRHQLLLLRRRQLLPPLVAHVLHAHAFKLPNVWRHQVGHHLRLWLVVTSQLLVRGDGFRRGGGSRQRRAEQCAHLGVHQQFARLLRVHFPKGGARLVAGAQQQPVLRAVRGGVADQHNPRSGLPASAREQRATRRLVQAVHSDSDPPIGLRARRYVQHGGGAVALQQTAEVRGRHPQGRADHGLVDGVVRHHQRGVERVRQAEYLLPGQRPAVPKLPHRSVPVDLKLGGRLLPLLERRPEALDALLLEQALEGVEVHLT